MRGSSIVGIAGLALVLSGCAGYRLGPTSGVIAGAKSIRVNPFQNQTQEPRMVEALTSALRQSLQQDGTYRLTTREDQDIVVNGVILRFDRFGVSFRPDDVLTLKDYYAAVVVKVTAVDSTTGKVILDREVAGKTTVRMGNDQASAERQAMPLLAEDLARNITSLLVEGTW